MNQAGDYEKSAWNKSLKWLTYRQRSKKELKDYLSEKGFSDDVIEQVIQRLQNIGLIDDHHFAREWIDYSFRKGRGSLRILYDLKERGIDEPVASEILQERLSGNSEYTRACNLIDKYLSPDYGQDDKKLLRKTVAYLKRRGYPNKIVYEVINKYFF